MVQENSSNAMQGIGASLKSWRAMGGLTADELAQSVGVSRDTISRVERGDTSVGVGTVLDICGEFGLLGKVRAAFDPANSELGKIGLSRGVPKRVRKAQDALPGRLKRGPPSSKARRTPSSGAHVNLRLSGRRTAHGMTACIMSITAWLKH